MIAALKLLRQRGTLQTEVFMQTHIRPGEIWLDTKGERIQAHGGAVYYENGTYEPEKYQATDAERREMYAGNVLETAETRIADYVWLPIEWEGDKPIIRWRDFWTVG